MKIQPSFNDVLIVPKYSTVISRAHVNTKVEFLGEKVFPVISSNMDSVTGNELSNAMSAYGAMGALHRFQSIEDNVKMFKKAPRSIVSIGLGDLELERAAALLMAGATKFLIDVAHGAHIEVVRQTKALRHLIGVNNYIIVGNFATKDSVTSFLKELGSIKIDAIKVGIGGGSACTTRVVTGCGLPTLASLLEIKELGIPMIADGGIAGPGDLAKALAAGATTVMIGRLLASTNESLGEIVENYLNSDFNKIRTKRYKGSASKESYQIQSKQSKHRTPEGESFLVQLTGPAANTLEQLEAGLRSAMSYVSAHTIEQFRENAQLVRVSINGYKEGTAHGKS